MNLIIIRDPYYGESQSVIACDKHTEAIGAGDYRKVYLADDGLVCEFCQESLPGFAGRGAR